MSKQPASSVVGHDGAAARLAGGRLGRIAGARSRHHRNACDRQCATHAVSRREASSHAWHWRTDLGAIREFKARWRTLGHDVGRGTIANVLRNQGIDPAPERGKRTSWSTFLKAHRESAAATDFFTVEVCTVRGLVTHYVLFVLDLVSRAVKIAGITPYPNEAWMMQMARTLTDAEDPVTKGARDSYQVTSVAALAAPLFGIGSGFI